ncbi:transglutaminase family protein [Janibacter terrae]|uniref:transglutaminase family protein n=1 Tax=Janibacter terrae TaxID=103817 RepID=UPI003808F46A
MRGDPRVVAGLLGAAAVVAVTLPLGALFEEAPWMPPAVAGVLAVAGSGMLLRALTPNAGLVIVGQTLAATLYVLLTQLRDTLYAGLLPTPETLAALTDHVADAQRTVTTYAAPAPSTPGIVVMLVIIVVVVTLAVDMSSATAGSPTVAGLPLLSLFLVSAANSGGSLHWGWFLGGAGLWLAMVVHQSDLDLRGWATSIPLLAQGDGQQSATRAHRWQAVRLGAIAIAGAIAVTTVVPHMPTRFVLDGLGRRGTGVGDGTGIRLSTQLDLKRSLESPSQVPVLRYTTDDPTPQPLRVAVVEDFTDGFGRMTSRTRQPQEGFVPRDPLADLPEGVARDRRNVIVEDNSVSAPQLPLPALVDSADLGGIAWSLGRDGTARVQRTPGTYSASFTELDPQDEDFPAGSTQLADPVDPTAYRDEYLTLDPGSSVEITELADSLTTPGESEIRAARAIQEYLRGPDFDYDLELPPSPPGRDPVVHFLRTKVGYCQQFATTMTLLARARGIPARVVVGFLPGSSPDGRQRVVRASDAHAWPELYFEGVGWVRFEPTPGARAASVPGYTIQTSETGDSTDSATSSSSTTSSSSAAAQPGEEATSVDPTAVADEGTPRWVWWLLGLAGLALLLAIVPVTARLSRRRGRSRAEDDAARVEREWQELVSQLDDLGIRAPVGSTPRQAGAWLGHRMALEPHVQDQLDLVVRTLETARYAPAGSQLPDVSHEVDAVVGRVRSSRQRSAQVRSLLWPQDGVDTWRALGRALSRRLTRRR